MWNWLNKNSSRECDEFCGFLEGSANQGQSDAAKTALFAAVPAKLREHAASCETCRTFADELLQVRAMLSGSGNQAQPGPFFLARVMAAIADRETRIETAAQTWAAVPRLASRLTVLASLGLLIAASWVYGLPRTSRSSPGIVSSSQPAEGLVDGGAIQDDLLVSAR
ncbi:MAG TPA: hypothetical protein VLC94_10470 [Candidatus Acidoferrum sp.]|nr:hypothetical protein [Candidatus Acidoferrum sp.]